MTDQSIGKIVKITGYRILVQINDTSKLHYLDVNNFIADYVSLSSLIGTHLVDGRILVMLVEEIYENNDVIYITASITGVYDEVSRNFKFGTNSYPVPGEKVFKLKQGILHQLFGLSLGENKNTIGTYLYNQDVLVGYDPNVLFGKHLGVFGNTGSGKTCTVVSLIQRYIRKNPKKDIKFIILDVNGEYKTAFSEDEEEYIPFDKLRFHHTGLSNDEYGRLFRAAEGIQYPALKYCLENLRKINPNWDLTLLPGKLDNWIQKNSTNQFSTNQLNGFLRTLQLRIDGIMKDSALMNVINSSANQQTMDFILQGNKKVYTLDLQVSNDALDIVIYLLFKAIYQYKVTEKDCSHICLVLEEAHHYINKDSSDSKLGSYYIDKLAREGRKFGIGLIISSQIPSMLSYDVVSQCNSVIMHKITNRRDLEFLRNVLRISNDTFYLQMSALGKQYAIVCGEAFSSDTVVKIHDANPLPRSNDPVIGDI